MEDYDRNSDDEQQLTGTMERLRMEIERLLEAYGGNYSEVIEAYKQAEQAANRRAKRLERQALQAKHEWQIANYELRLAKDIIDDIQRGR
jgi:FKBP-type peptidyl-prolyl cis-trans isomerase (trigger factor)